MIAYIRLGIVVLIILSLLGNFLLLKENDKLSGERSQLLVAAQDSGHIARVYINLHGQEVSKNMVLTQDLRNAKELKGNKAFAMAKETEGVKKNLRNLEEVSNTEIVSKGEIKVKLKDSIPSSVPLFTFTPAEQPVFKTFSYKDEHKNILKGFVTNDTIQVEAEIPTDLDGVVYWKRKHKFLFVRYGPKEIFSELKSSNPWVKIKNQETIKIQKYGK